MMGSISVSTSNSFPPVPGEAERVRQLSWSGAAPGDWEPRFPEESVKLWWAWLRLFTLPQLPWDQKRFTATRFQTPVRDHSRFAVSATPTTDTGQKHHINLSICNIFSRPILCFASSHLARCSYAERCQKDLRNVRGRRCSTTSRRIPQFC